MPDVQRKSAPTSRGLDGRPSSTSRENVFRRPKESSPDVQRKMSPTSRETVQSERSFSVIHSSILSGRRGTFPLDVGAHSLWTSGHIFSGRRDTFSLEVGAYFLWTSAGVAHPILWTSGHIFSGRRTYVARGPLFWEPLKRPFGEPLMARHMWRRSPTLDRRFLSQRNLQQRVEYAVALALNMSLFYSSQCRFQV